MSEKYIKESDVLLALVEKGQASKRYKIGEFWELNGEEIRQALEFIPADSDVVKVVRCCACKSYNRPRLGFCELHLVRMHSDDYCSYGKEKENK